MKKSRKKGDKCGDDEVPETTTMLFHGKYVRFWYIYMYIYVGSWQNMIRSYVLDMIIIELFYTYM